MIDLDDLRAFQRVATLLSFSEAARTMGVRKSAVSRAVQRLETALGVRLFDRTTRMVALTDAGLAMATEINDVAGRLDRIVDLAADLGNYPRGRLRVSAGIGFGLEVLTELLPKFSKAYPDIAVSLDLTSRVVDLVAERVDIAFRMGPLANSELVTIRIGSIGSKLCASPAYLRSRGQPTSIEELADHDLIAIPLPNGLPRPWTLRHTDGAERTIPTAAPLGANDPHAITRMVEHGAGVAAVANFVADPEIALGRLCPVLPEWSVPPVDVSIVMLGGREKNPAVRAFVDFIRAEAAARPEWFKP